MKDYNHKAKTIEEAIGIDSKDLALKTNKLMEHEHSLSKFIENLENTFDKRELAFISSMVLTRMNEETSPKELEIKVMKIDDESIPLKVKEAVKNMLKELDDKDPDSFDPECQCPRCKKNRAKVKTKGTNKDFSFLTHESQGDC